MREIIDELEIKLRNDTMKGVCYKAFGEALLYTSQFFKYPIFDEEIEGMIKDRLLTPG